MTQALHPWNVRLAVLLMIAGLCPAQEHLGIRGRVVDGQGAPCVERVLRLHHVGLHDGRLDPGYGWPEPLADGMPVSRKVVTDAEGRFEAQGLAAGEYWIFTRSQDIWSWSGEFDRLLGQGPVAKGEDAGDLVFVDRRLHVRLADRAGAPVRLASHSGLSLYRVDEEGRIQGAARWMPFEAEADGWSIPVERDAHFLVQLYAPGHPLVQRPVAVGAAERTEVKLVLGAAVEPGRVTGIVRGPDGKPFDGTWSLQAYSTRNGALVTGASAGGFQREPQASLELPPGAYRLVAQPIAPALWCSADLVEPPDHLPAEQVVQVEPGQSLRVNLELPLGSLLAVAVEGGTGPRGSSRPTATGPRDLPIGAHVSRRRALGGVRLWLENGAGKATPLRFRSGHQEPLVDGGFAPGGSLLRRSHELGSLDDYVLPGHGACASNALPQGSWILRGEAEGFEPVAVPVELLSGKVQLARIALVPLGR